MIRILGRGAQRERREFSARFELLAQQLANLEPAADRSALAVGVTSCRAGAGVTTVAVNLALSATQVFFRPVLLIDARPEKPSLAKEFGVPPEPGLVEVLRNESPLADCVRATTVRHLSVLPAGNGSGRWTLSSPLASEMFVRLRQDYSLIVLDLAPVAEERGVVPFANLLDGYLLVMEPTRSRVADLRRAQEKFQQVRGKLLGVVLNKDR